MKGFFFNFWVSIFLLQVCTLESSLPPYISLGGGIFDVLREKYRTAEFSIEYKSTPSSFFRLNRSVDVRFLGGAMVTWRRSSYLYGGVLFDLRFSFPLIISPSFSMGWYQKGRGKDLGYPLEFRSAIEGVWQFKDSHRMGVRFSHLSNASLSSRNPGEESLVFFYEIPIQFWH